MQVNVNFCGKLGDEFSGISLEVNTPEEVIGLMEVNNPGFRQKLIAGNYILVMHDGREEEGSAVAVDHLNSTIPLSSPDLYFISKPRGEAATAFVYLTSQIVISTGVTTMTGVYLSAAVAAAVVAAGYIGIAIGLSSLADSLMPGLEENIGDAAFAFDGPVNNTRQGNPVPVCYGGPIRVGSQVVSVSLKAVDI